MARLLLLDVSSLMYRAHFALPDSIRGPEGRRVGAVHGYLDMVARLLVSRRPDEAVHVYDHDWRPAGRTRIYPGYKAKRPPAPAVMGRTRQRSDGQRLDCPMSGARVQSSRFSKTTLGIPGPK